MSCEGDCREFLVQVCPLAASFSSVSRANVSNVCCVNGTLIYCERLLKVNYRITIIFKMYYILKYIYLKFDKHLQDAVSFGPKLVLKRKF